jgi:hypothetical protein
VNTLKLLQFVDRKVPASLSSSKLMKAPVHRSVLYFSPCKNLGGPLKKQMIYHREKGENEIIVHESIGRLFTA